jgi:hypothetical protein
MAESPELWPYGSRPKLSAPEHVIVSTADMLAVLGDWTELLGYFVRTIPVAYFSTAELCSKQPSEYGDLNLGDWLAALVNPTTHRDLALKIVARAARANWHTYCEFIPAPNPTIEPTPEPEPLPEPPPVEDAPELPPPSATSLDELGMLASWIYRLVGELKFLVDRNQVLVTYIADHTQTLTWTTGESLEITGTGAAFLQPADGYWVTLDTVPAYTGHSAGDDPAYFDAGFFSYGTWLGQRETVRLSRSSQFFYPSGLELHRITWELPPGVEATVTCLLRVPYPDAPPRTEVVFPG